MKVSVIQLDYSTDFSKCDEYFEKTLTLLDKCDKSSDIIVLPESSDIPCRADNEQEHLTAVEKYTKILLEKAANTAKRCESIVFINGTDYENGNYNTTFAINKNGEICGKYYKEHLTPTEPTKYGRVADYSFKFSAPYVLTIDGMRFGFLTCYDNYFYEIYPNLARQNLDFIIACSHQRSDLHSALKFMTQFCAYNTNTYVLRASVSMGENSEYGGTSMIVSPKGEILAETDNGVGIISADIDVNEKYYKPAGFGNPPAAHYEYIEEGRRPFKYRPAGSAICLNDEQMPYPRVCAHRGFNTVAPENSMPAFGAAVAMGAEEIEFDLWYTKDGEIVSIHDSSLDRVSDGTGKVYEHTFEELKKYDFGIKKGEKFAGLKILKFENILKKFACHTIMNIHIKSISTEEYSDENIEKIVALIKKYDCEKYVYFMTGDDNLMQKLKDKAPEICRCMGGGSIEKRWKIVERAIKYDCKKVQLFKPYFNKEMIDKAHENGIMCNVFWSDKPEETQEFLEMGIDTILTNDYNLISQTVKNKAR